MPHINIEISHNLLTQMQVACAISKQSQKEFVLQAIGERCLQGYTVVEHPPIVAKANRVTAADTMEAIGEVLGGMQCKRCGSPVNRDPKNVRYWYCITCKRQMDDREVH